MNGIEIIPNKRRVDVSTAASVPWPDLGENFVLNQFYKNYSGAEGWLGEAYLVVWGPEEALDFRGPNSEVYPDKYQFFASDGGGTQFGFFVSDDNATYVSAPNIGGEEDIRVLGEWQDFIHAIEAADYI